MTTSPTAAPPSWTTDLGDVIERALAVMRLAPSDIDADRVALAAQAAALLIDDHLDRGLAYFTPASVPEPVLGACVQVTIELYRRKDAPFGVVNGWSPTDMLGPQRIGTDWIKGVETQIDPYRLTFGVW